VTEGGSLERAEELLSRVEAVRARLADVPEGGAEAVEVLAELDEIAKMIQAELERARLEAS